MMQLIHLFLLLFLQGCTVTQPEVYPPYRGNVDPYIIYNENGTIDLKSFDKSQNIYSERFNSREQIDLIRVETQEGNYYFNVKLHDNIVIPDAHYEIPEQIFVISDPHGDAVSFITGLQGNKIIDDEFNWIFGQNHLVVLGDVHNRGDDVTAIFWLIYKLEAQAQDAGGAVHLLLGNHEVMVAQNDLRYTNEKYDKIANEIGIGFDVLWSNKTELGRWVQSRNTMMTIGDILFLHAGVSPELAETDLTITQVNDTVRKYMALPRRASEDPSSIAHLVMRTNGPLWYRGLATPDETVNKTVVSGILDRFGVKKIIIGHTILPEISTLFDGLVISTKVNTQRNLEREASRALMITPNDIWSVDNNGKRMEFE
ncbi:MAG: metallophosphoesterase [Dysgonamonadaceae bacterium]|nr:metallophosphoesterase [Dysgonamonadaceae bacterium]